MNAKITAYIGLGSNLQAPVEQITQARYTIATHTELEELAFSSLYQSEPMGPKEQPDYINAVMAITTELSPLALLKILQVIEKQQGRVREGERWGARTLDLDILLYGNLTFNNTELTIPHEGLSKRAFVLYPLAEIAPELFIPLQGKLVDLLANCPELGLKRLKFL